MENIQNIFNDKYSKIKDSYNNIQTNGTPIREISKKLREETEKSYHTFIVKTNEIEGKYSSLRDKYDNILEQNKNIIDYFRLHPSVTILTSTSIVSIPSYLAFGSKGFVFGVIGTASFSTLLVGALIYRHKSSRNKTN